MITISRKEGPFEAEITGGLLSVRRDFQPVFTCRMNVQPWFVVHSDGLYAQNAHDALTPLYRGEDSNVLLMCLNSVLRQNETRRSGFRLAGVGVMIAALFIGTVVALSTPKAHEVPAVYSPLTASEPAPGTLEILQLMAGTEYRAQMGSLVQQGGLTGGGWDDDTRLTIREQKKVEVEEVQSLQEGENVTLFKGQVIRGSSLYISDIDKLSREEIRINRFVEVAPPSEKALLATAPFRRRRSHVRSDRVQRILRVLDESPGPQDTTVLVLTDPALAAVCEFSLECEFSWRRAPNAAVRSSVLWRMVQESLPVRGRGFRSRLRHPRQMNAGMQAIELAAQNHVVIEADKRNSGN